LPRDVISTPPDTAELTALRAGETDAVNHFVRTHTGWMLATARRYLRDRALAKDCVQEALMSALANIDRFEGRSGLKAWLHRITVNAALMKLRSRRREDDRDVEEVLPQCEAEGLRRDAPWIEPPRADAPMESQETCALVREQIARLPATHRDVLQLRDIEGLSTAEAAARLGISDGAAKVRLHRARAALKTLIEPVLQAGQA
jgi:RNA polymerase sigma-70 factor (ECF subfamily)